MLKQKLLTLPKDPGVYIFKNSENQIIYIGKAINLKNRVKSYFASKHENSIKTQFLVKNIVDLDYIIVDNELEALLLENKLIKKHKPKYNINLKDGKTYAYIKITDDEIPMILTTRKVTEKGEYFGPYTDGYLRKELITLCVRIFGLVTPKTYSNKSHLYYEIGIAPARKLTEINREEYLKKVKQAKEFLKGKNIRKIAIEVQNQMNEFSKKQRYEDALEMRKALNSLLLLEERQKVDLVRNFDQDVIAYLHEQATQKCYIQLFHVSRGVISGKKEFNFDFDSEVYEEFIKIYYSNNTPPKEILVNKKFWDSEEKLTILEKYLSNKRGSKSELKFPKIGEKKKIVELAEKNAKKNFGENSILREVQRKLKLPREPKVIECFDMSNLGSEYLVGAMTRWVNGLPDKSGYRRFEIKHFKGKNDDFASMKEVVYRRYKRLVNEQKSLPDLIIIDGGKGQLSAALSALNNVKVQPPIIALAKKEEEIFLPGEPKPLKFPKNSKMMLFIRSIRDSVHNYVVSYNRKKREMKFREDTT